MPGRPPKTGRALINRSRQDRLIYGAGLSAVAEIENGSVTRLHITCPGRNLEPGDLLTFRFHSGGPTTPAAGLESIRIRIPAAQAPQGRIFGRLRAENLPN